MAESQRYRDALKFHNMDTTTSGVVTLREGNPARLHALVSNTIGAVVRIFNGPDVEHELVASAQFGLPGTIDYFGTPLPSGLTVEKATTGGNYTVIYE